MPTIHFLNVKQGDCSVIEHISGHVSVLDVCNAKPADTEIEKSIRTLAESGILGNFNQKQYPVNPVTYLQERAIASVFRFILTHPDMDHMDGIGAFFDAFSPLNFWDTDNTCAKEFGDSDIYSENDWDFYCGLRDGQPTSDPKRLVLYSGSRGAYYNQSGEGESGGDGLHVLSPTAAIVANANECDDFNDCSYVILYKTGNRRIVFGGDSHDGSWEHILEEHKKDVENVDLLIAPHHGRKSGRSYDFLDTLKPKLTFFGNASCEDLAYGAWNSRDLPFITNNQAGSMVIDVVADGMRLYVTHKPFAQKLNSATFYDNRVRAYYCGEI